MRLTGEEKSILDGKQGEAARIALSVLSTWEIFSVLGN